MAILHMCLLRNGLTSCRDSGRHATILRRAEAHGGLYQRGYAGRAVHKDNAAHIEPARINITAEGCHSVVRG